MIGYFKLLAPYSFLGRPQIRCSEMMMAGVHFGKLDHDWLVVSNMFFFPYIGDNHPN